MISFAEEVFAALRKKVSRRLALLMMLLMLLPILSACTPRLSPERTVRTFFDGMIRKDYSLCYSCLDAQSMQNITLSEFVNRYNVIYDAMELESLGYELGAGVLEGENYVFPCTLTYQCRTLGTFTQTISLTLTPQSNDWAISWSPNVILTDLDWDDEVRVQTLSQKRGEILDANGNAFAINTYADTVYVDLNEIGDYGATARTIAPLLSMTEAEVQSILNSERAQTDRVAILTYFVPGTLPDTLRAQLLAVQGVGIDSEKYTPIRYYPQDSMLAHTIGYTSVITAEDLETLDADLYGMDSQVGRSGLELSYEELLVGKRGKELYIRTPTQYDAVTQKPTDYKRKTTVVRVEPVNGCDLELTIDFALQRRAENALAALGEDRAGSVVVLDPQKGAVLASATYPTYSNNIFADRNVSALYEQVLSIPRSALYNRVTRGLYPPGSTVKPLVAAMSLETGAFDMEYEFDGEVYQRQWLPTMHGWVYPAITRVSDYKRPYNMENAIINSDNIFFANVALTCGWEDVVGLYEQLGFDTPIDYDIPVATPSIYNDDSWSNLRLLADMGYGQGELLITPLQMASVFSAFANGGNIMRPYIVGALKSTAQNGHYVTESVTEPTLWRSNVLDASSIDLLEPILIKTVDSNAKLAMRSLQFAGKTGTAQLDGNNEREIAWLIVYVTNTDYERLICVCLELEADNPTARYDVAVPLMLP